MCDCKCGNSENDLGTASIDLALQTGFGRQSLGRLHFFVDNHPLVVTFTAAAFGICGVVGVKLAHADRNYALVVLAIALLTIPAIILPPQMSSHRPASPGYVLAALRSVARHQRRAFLDRLNTALLRGQRIPASRLDVMVAARVLGVRAYSQQSRAEARQRRAAQMQARLIDSFLEN
jgi:ABC-type anion transport system duplicated permease subunit